MSDQMIELSIPRRYLVHDEIEGFLSAKSVNYEFRIRVWRSECLTPVVLVSQITGGAPPRFLVCKIANYCYSVLLGYNSRIGMLYFHDEISNGGCHYLSQTLFEFFGNKNRLRLFRPDSQLRDWDRLEYLLGESVEP